MTTIKEHEKIIRKFIKEIKNIRENAKNYHDWNVGITDQWDIKIYSCAEKDKAWNVWFTWECKFQPETFNNMKDLIIYEEFRKKDYEKNIKGIRIRI